MDLLNSVLWFVVTLGLLAWLQPRLHQELQQVFVLITRNPKISILLFSLILFPGVFLHELSHYLAAKLLRVRTGRFSVFPSDMNDGRLRMGYVEVASTDLLRDSLIGAAPLLTGSGLVAYVGISRLGLNEVMAAAQSDIGDGISMLFGIFEHPDVWLWLYLALAVSSTMFPSASDRKPWIKVGVALAVILGLVLLFGAGSQVIELVQPGLSQVVAGVVGVFSISIGLHLFLLIPLTLIRRLLQDLMS